MQGDGSDYARITVNGNRMERCYGGWYDPEYREPFREVPYADVPDEPQGALFPPGGNYGPHKREFVDWQQCEGEYRGEWRGWAIRVWSQLDSYQGRNVVRWYADVRGRQRVHAKWSAAAAQQAACEWVDAEERR